MKAISINGEIKTYNDIPKTWNNTIGYNYQDASVWESDGFRDVVEPTYNSTTQYKGGIVYDETNNFFTYAVIDFTPEQLATNLQIEAIEDLQTAVQQADIICCATNSYEPLLKGAWLQAGQHLDLVGSYTPEMREVDDQAIQRSSVYVDSRWFTIDCAGDLTQPIANGVFKAEQVVADLFELCSQQKPGRSSPQQITLFKSGGGAHLDLMTASYVAQMGLADSAS